MVLFRKPTDYSQLLLVVLYDSFYEQRKYHDMDSSDIVCIQLSGRLPWIGGPVKAQFGPDVVARPAERTLLQTLARSKKPDHGHHGGVHVVARDGGNIQDGIEGKPQQVGYYKNEHNLVWI